MKVNNDSSYFERLEFAELAKLKEEYANLGFECQEHYQIQSTSNRMVECDLFLENRETGEKIVFEVKVRGHKNQAEALVQRRKEIKKAIPGVKFYVRIIEEPQKPENKFYGLENLIGYLFKYKHQKELEKAIGNEFEIFDFKDVMLSTVKIEERGTKLQGSAYIVFIYKTMQEQMSPTSPDMLYFKFSITFKDLFAPWEYPYFSRLSFLSSNRDPIIDKFVSSEFNFDLDGFY